MVVVKKKRVVQRGGRKMSEVYLTTSRVWLRKDEVGEAEENKRVIEYQLKGKNVQLFYRVFICKIKKKSIG